MQYYGTLGPACVDGDILAKMFLAGMTGIRLNLSHGDLEERRHWLDLLKQAAGQCGVVPEILIDLRGPELRLGKIERDLELEEGQMACLMNGELLGKGSSVRPAEYLGKGGILSGEGKTVIAKNGFQQQDVVPGHAAVPGHEAVLPVPAIFMKYAESGDHVLIDDGKIELEIVRPQEASDGDFDCKGKNTRSHSIKPAECRTGALQARVIRGGRVAQEKSLAIVGRELPMPTLTESDYRNIGLAARYGVTGVMLPFVRNRGDLITLRDALEAAGAGEVKIFAKIENMQGVRGLAELIPFADCVVIARGDLGNAMPLWKLPGVQKQISAVCRKAGKSFMVVTQMLDSMHERAVPTRAEVSDIYNAVLDGADSLMLTGETAVGKYPVEAMEYLVKTGEEGVKELAGA